MSRRRFLALAGAFGVAALTGWVGDEVYRPRLERWRRPLPGLRAPLRVALLTDLHLGPWLYPRQLAGWLERTAALEPDLVLLGGDLVDYRFDRDPAELAALVELRPPLGVAAVWGNHDRWRYPDPAPLAAVLEAAGVRVLVNAWWRVRDDLIVAGVDDLLTGAADLEAALAGAPDDPALIFLSHNPDLLPRLPQRVGLALCGHTHGGQVRIPGYGAPIVPSAYGQRFAQGWVDAPRPAYVSRGLGVSGVPVRFACPAELTLLELEPA